MKPKFIKGKQLVCTKPFHWFELGWNKQAYSCCSGWVTTPIGKLPEQTASGVWFGERAREFRASVLDGSFKFCKTEFCPHLRELSGPVMYLPDAYVEELKMQVAQPELPKRLNCSYDSSCNLSCPSCRTDVQMSTKSERLANDLIFEHLLEEFGENLEHIVITGSGDPFASRHFWNILTNGCLTKYPNINIRLHTNGQLLDAKHWHRLAPLHQQIKEIEISFDGASKLSFEANRYPAQWDKQMENFDFIAKVRAANGLNWLQSSFVVQSNNWHEMIDFVHLSLAHNVDHILFTALNNWGTFSESTYAEKAVHKPAHKSYEHLVELLKDPIFQHPKVCLGISENLNAVSGSGNTLVQNPDKIKIVELS
jgi:sulfatase maturation enzyme AslB (radical SAM superfamily)